MGWIRGKNTREKRSFNGVNSVSSKSRSPLCILINRKLKGNIEHDSVNGNMITLCSLSICDNFSVRVKHDKL